MIAARTVLVAVRAVFAAIVLIVFFDRVVEVHNAHTAFAGTFLLGHGWHGLVLSIRGVMGMRKQMLNHDIEN